MEVQPVGHHFSRIGWYTDQPYTNPAVALVALPYVEPVGSHINKTGWHADQPYPIRTG